MSRLVNDPITGLHTSSDKASYKGNFQGELPSPTITWKTFVRYVCLLNPKRVSFKVEFEWHDGTKTEHAVTTDIISVGELDAVNIASAKVANGNKKKLLKDLDEAIKNKEWK